MTITVAGVTFTTSFGWLECQACYGLVHPLAIGNHVMRHRPPEDVEPREEYL